MSALRGHLRECGVGAQCPLCSKRVTQKRYDFCVFYVHFGGYLTVVWFKLGLNCQFEWFRPIFDLKLHKFQYAVKYSPKVHLINWAKNRINSIWNFSTNQKFGKALGETQARWPHLEFKNDQKRNEARTSSFLLKIIFHSKLCHSTYKIQISIYFFYTKW